MKLCNTCKEEKSFTEFHKHSKSADGHVPRCKQCSKHANRDWFNRNRQQVLSKRRQRIQQLLEESNELKAQSGCVCCVEKEPACLDWHHINPSTKDHNISYLIENIRRDLMLVEIEKCVVLCANCHRKVHAGIITL